jgi:hypothetical protein
MGLSLVGNGATFVGLVGLFVVTAADERMRELVSYLAAGFSLLQWPFLVPVGVYGVAARSPVAQGMLIGGVVATLLNTGCTTWVMYRAGWFTP